MNLLIGPDHNHLPEGKFEHGKSNVLSVSGGFSTPRNVWHDLSILGAQLTLHLSWSDV